MISWRSRGWSATAAKVGITRFACCSTGARTTASRQVSSLGDANISLGDANISLGDAQSSLGDAESSLGDAKSSLGDAESSLGDAESSLGDAKSSLGDAESSLGDAKSSLGDAKSSLGGVSQYKGQAAGPPLFRLVRSLKRYVQQEICPKVAVRPCLFRHVVGTRRQAHWFDVLAACTGDRVWVDSRPEHQAATPPNLRFHLRQHANGQQCFHAPRRAPQRSA